MKNPFRRHRFDASDLSYEVAAKALQILIQVEWPRQKTMLALARRCRDTAPQPVIATMFQKFVDAYEQGRTIKFGTFPMKLTSIEDVPIELVDAINQIEKEMET